MHYEMVVGSLWRINYPQCIPISNNVVDHEIVQDSCIATLYIIINIIYLPNKLKFLPIAHFVFDGYNFIIIH